MKKKELILIIAIVTTMMNGCVKKPLNSSKIVTCNEAHMAMTGSNNEIIVRMKGYYEDAILVNINTVLNKEFRRGENIILYIDGKKIEAVACQNKK